MKKVQTKTKLPTASNQIPMDSNLFDNHRSRHENTQVDSPGQARGTYRNGFFETGLTSAVRRDKEFGIHPRVNPWFPVR